MEKRAKKTEGGLLSGWANKVANKRLEQISGSLILLYSTTTINPHSSQLGMHHHMRQLKMKVIHLSSLEESLMKMNLSSQSELLVI